MAYAANFIPEVWSKKLQKIFDRDAVFTKLVNRDYEGEIKAGGDTVHVRSFGEITIRSYTREGTLTLDTLTDPMSDLTVDQEKYFAFQVDDVDKAQSDISIMEGYAKRAADAIRRTVDQHLHSQYANVASGNIIGSSSAPISLTKDNIYEYIVDMGKLLDQANAPEDGRNLVVDPTRKALLLKSPEFTRATGLGDKVVQNGRIGEVGGFMVHCTTNLNSSSGNVPIMAFTKDLISYANQVTKMEKVRPTDKFTDVMKGLFVYGSKIFTNANLTVSKGPDSQGAVLWAAGT